MKLEEHIFFAFDALIRGEPEHALLHSCIAIDASSKKHFEANKSGRKNYQEFIREYYWILEPMMATGINFSDKQWEDISKKDLDFQKEKNKDLAAFIYYAFRCTQVHGNEIDPVYKLSPFNPDGTSSFSVADGRLNLPAQTSWGLLAICVFAKTNNDISTESGYYLSLGGNHFSISDWWGLENSFKPIAEKHNQERVKLEFGGLKETDRKKQIACS